MHNHAIFVLFDRAAPSLNIASAEQGSNEPTKGRNTTDHSSRLHEVICSRQPNHSHRQGQEEQDIQNENQDHRASQAAEATHFQIYKTIIDH